MSRNGNICYYFNTRRVERRKFHKTPLPYHTVSFCFTLFVGMHLYLFSCPHMRVKGFVCYNLSLNVGFVSICALWQSRHVTSHAFECKSRVTLVIIVSRSLSLQSEPKSQWRLSVVLTFRHCSSNYTFSLSTFCTGVVCHIFDTCVYSNTPERISAPRSIVISISSQLVRCHVRSDFTEYFTPLLGFVD